MTWRVVYFGTPTFALPALRALLEHPGFDVVTVVSQPDRGSGRGKRVQSPPVVEMARAAGVEVWQPTRLRDGVAAERLRALAPDFFVVAAYGRLLPPDLLAIPRFAPVNLHGSLLPRWRGAAPVQWAVATGDRETGISYMHMEEGLDTGAVYRQATLAIGDDETAGAVLDRLAVLGAQGLSSVLEDIAAGSCLARPQPEEGVTHARPLVVADRRLPLDRDARLSARYINGMSPWPGVCFRCGDERVSVLRARPSERSTEGHPPGHVVHASPKQGLFVAAADGRCVEWLEVQRPGKRPMPACDALHGFCLPAGTSLDPDEGRT